MEIAPDASGDCGPDARLVDDMGYDSVALLELVFALEEEFELDPILAEDARSILTVKQVESLVEIRLERRD